MSQARHNWPVLLIDCIVGACAGLLIGLILPIGSIFGRVEPGQSGTIFSVIGIMFAVVFYSVKLRRSNTKEVEKTSVRLHATMADTGMSAEGWVLAGIVALLVIAMLGFALVGLPTPRGTPGSAYPPTINGQ